MPKSAPIPSRLPRLALLIWLLAAAGSAMFWWISGRPVDVADATVAAIPCLSYAPFRGSETAADRELVIPAERIDADLALLSTVTRCVRTYTVSQGMQYVPEAAERLGMTVLVGAWIGDELDRNHEETAQAIAIANRFPQTVRMVIVGNETLLRNDVDEEALRGFLRTTRAQTDVAVGYADVWEKWLQYRDLVEDVDVVIAHILPYWEDEPVAIEAAVNHFRTIWAELNETFPHTPIYVGETGWPSAGRMRGPSEPGRLNQALFLRDILSFANAEAIPVNVVEAFDQQWKVVFEGAAGGGWGIFDEDRRLKVPLAGAVSENPSWAVHLGVSLVLALAATVLLMNTRVPSTRRAEVSAAIASHAGAVILVMAGMYLIDSSHGPAAWLFGGSVWLAAGGSALLAGVILLGPSSRPIPTLSEVFSRIRQRDVRFCVTKRGAFAVLRAFLLTCVLVTLLLMVADGRYRGFPAALYLLPAVSFTLVTWTRAPLPHAGDRWEVMLSFAAGAAVIALLAREGLANHQAIAWAAVVLPLTLAAPLHAAFRRYRRMRERVPV